MNIENIRALAKKMRRLRHEEHYDQGLYVEKTACGTVACLAGHAALMAGWKPFKDSEGNVCDYAMKGPEGKMKDIATIAKQHLGINTRKAIRLFTPNPEDDEYTRWPEEFAARWEAAVFSDSDERPSRIAADLLDAIAAGKVKL